MGKVLTPLRPKCLLPRMLKSAPRRSPGFPVPGCFSPYPRSCLINPPSLSLSLQSRQLPGHLSAPSILSVLSLPRRPSPLHVPPEGPWRPFPGATGGEEGGCTPAPTRSAMAHTLGAPSLHWAAGLRGYGPGRPRRRGGNSPSLRQGRASTTTVPLPANAAGRGIGPAGGGGEAGTSAAATAASAAEQAG